MASMNIPQHYEVPMAESVDTAFAQVVDVVRRGPYKKVAVTDAVRMVTFRTKVSLASPGHLWMVRVLEAPTGAIADVTITARGNQPHEQPRMAGLAADFIRHLA